MTSLTDEQIAAITDTYAQRWKSSGGWNVKRCVQNALIDARALLSASKPAEPLVTTVWRDGTWTQWSERDATCARDDGDWLVEIPAAPAQSTDAADAGRYRKLRARMVQTEPPIAQGHVGGASLDALLDDAAPTQAPAQSGERDRLLAALERAAAAESALRALADECENDAVAGWEDRMRERIEQANRVLVVAPAQSVEEVYQIRASRFVSDWTDVSADDSRFHEYANDLRRIVYAAPQSSQPVEAGEGETS